jgi:hypothetical protein
VEQSNKFYKNNPSDVIWWVENSDTIGEWLFSFDKETIFNMFADYPDKLTSEQKEIFDKENPFWADFFKDRV